jgi:GMP synthase-like glutamine amidotransferase
MFLILEHEESENPGIFQSVLLERGCSFKRIKLFRGEAIPDTKNVAGVLIMGGPMNVYEESAYPFLAEEDLFLKHCFCNAVPVLGICLGAQLIAKAAGAKIRKALAKEIGWYEVRLTVAGLRDPLLEGCAKTFPVFQFHEDTFDIPPDAVHIIEAPVCPHQGFRMGKTVYGLQFHFEATREMIADWVADQGEHKTRISEDTERNIASCHRQGKEFFAKFLSLCTPFSSAN